MNLMFYLVILLYSIVVRIGQADTKWLIDSVFVRIIYILGLIRFFYNVCLIVSRW